MTQTDIKEAITSSGFPLQVAISRRLNAIEGYPAVEVFQEWTYVDPVEQKQRALDIVLELKLPFDPKDQTYAELAMLIECKASRQPLVFFEAPAPYDLKEHRSYPKIAGLKRDRIKLNVATGLPPYVMIVPQQLLAFKTFSTSTNPAAHAHIYTKVVHDKGKLGTSGADVYNSIVLPLAKAGLHYAQIKEPAAQHTFFRAYAVFIVAVIDGPIVYSPLDGSDLLLAPWIRLSKHELSESPIPAYRDSLLTIDFVHADYFERYLTEYIIPFADQFAVRIKRQAKVLATGEGVLPRFHTYDDSVFYEEAQSL
jgi:hypothetical protein